MTDHDVRSQPAEPALSARSPDGGGWTGLVLGSALTAMALMAGLFYSFSVAVMTGLAGADDRTFVVAMQRINRAIQNPAFALAFAGALVLTALAAVLQRRLGPAGAFSWVIAALVLYGIVLAVTFGISIPLNDGLDRAGDPDRIPDLAGVRRRFEGPWVAWNIVRTLLSTAAVGTLARALVLHSCAKASPTAQATTRGRS